MTEISLHWFASSGGAQRVSTAVWRGGEIVPAVNWPQNTSQVHGPHARSCIGALVFGLRSNSQTAELTELKDLVEGLRAAAHTARAEGNITLAEALDITRFEVYESYLDEEYTNNTAKRLMIKS
jgi:hypothetical protein